METRKMQAFIVDGHDYFWEREDDKILVWDSSDTLIGSATPDIEGFYWIAEDAEGELLARLPCAEYSIAEAAHYIAAVAE